ncbi:MAG: 50S ribosomal protein L11 methyltransferase [Magnetococcales bacterium]|nr:50S ribosomal protein L11 methyltransferase [Magnetococcales bacterium]
MIYEIHIVAPSDLEDSISDFLMENGSMGSVVDISMGRDKPLVKGYFADPDRESLSLQLQLITVASGRSCADISIQWQDLEEKDWENAWKKHARPIATGRRLLILPSWLEVDKDNRRQLIRLDPQMAFGSGSHETTRGCLEALEKIADKGALGEVLDMGTGSGILSIGAVLLGAHQVFAVDNDPIAVETAEKNCQINGVGSKVALILSDCPPPGPFQTIVANILAHVLIEIRPSLVSSLAPGGYLVLSGILAGQADEVISAYQADNRVQWASFPMGEWVTLVFADHPNR